MSPGRVAIRLAGANFALLGAGFGLGALWAVAHLQRTGELPMTPWGFRAMSGPVEALGPRWVSALGAVFAGVCSLYVLAGVWLWRGERRGLRLGAAASAPRNLEGRLGCLARRFAWPKGSDSSTARCRRRGR